MSHTNRNFPPHFNFVLEEPSYTYDDQISQLNINTAESWLSSGSRSVQNQVPSPSTSVRTVMTAPDSRSFNRPGFHHANRSPIDNNIDPRLPNLSLHVPSGHVARSSYNPIARHFQEDQPWSAGNLRSSNTIGGRTPLSQANVQYGAYRDGPGSDIDSNVLPSDSGYHSQPPQSVFSNEPGHSSQEFSSRTTLKVGNLNVESALSQAPTMAPMQSDQLSQISSRSGKSGKIFQCPACDSTSKCKSDLKKHILKHEKPFKCDMPKCKRAGQGFTTVNDLDRHKKSVHRIGLRTKSYQCASENCRNKEKIWPRLDNFKQHIDRMHKDEDDLDLIKRSTLRPSEPAPVVENITVAPMDTNLAVAGMEKSFSGNPAMDPFLAQDTRRWSSPSQKPDNFAKDMYRMRSHPRGAIPGNNLTDSQGPEDLQAQPYIYQRASGITTRRDSQAIYANAETQAMTKQPSSESQNQRPRPSLSNAPQTKADQQKLALQKLPRATTGEMKSSTSELVDLEEILRILHKATNAANWDDTSSYQGKDIQEPQNSNVPITLTKGEALKASQAISNLIKQSPGSAYTVQRRSTQGSLPNAKVCPKCHYAVARDCDLRKHMKRHERPYGCTYPKCHKRFGAKSDWKRHENSQHFQMEAFRCARPSLSPSEAGCGQHFVRAEQFKEHLGIHHKIPDTEQRKEEVRLCTIGKNYQGRFWCGFCTRVLGLEERHNAAWDERFDHIAHHFEREKKSIDDWICVEENRTKKELLKEVGRHLFEDEDEKDVDAAGEVDDEALQPALVVPDERAMPWHTSPLPPSQTSQHANPKKRPASGEPSPQRRPTKRRVINRYCCHCSDGPCGSLQPACTNCGHDLCGNCHVDDFMMRVD